MGQPCEIWAEMNAHVPGGGGQVKSRFTLLGGKKAMCSGGGGPRAQGLVRAGVVPTTPRSLERVRREMSHLLGVLCRPGNFVRFLFEVCWLLSFFSPEVPVQGGLVRARGFRSRALALFNNPICLY